MKHVFLFAGYNNTENMAAAITELNSDDAIFIIHINRKQNIRGNKYIESLLQLHNVHFLNERVSVNWGGFSHLRAIIRLMETSLAYSESGDYVHLLSDSCFPIKSNKYIRDFFARHTGTEFINYEPLPNKSWPYGGLDRITYYHLHDVLNIKQHPFFYHLNKKFMLLQMHLGLKRNTDQNFGSYYGGSTWWSLSTEAVQYCVTRIGQMPDFYRRYKHSFCFEESCIQTLLMNSPFREKIANNNLRYIDWTPRNGNTPANLDASDYNKLMNTDALFARKFINPHGNVLREMLCEKPVTTSHHQ